MIHKQIENAYSDDYAVLEADKFRFYYGYEAEDENEEWCFTVEKHNNELFRVPKSEIEKRTEDRLMDTPQDYLLAGIGVWLLESFDTKGIYLKPKK